MSSQTDNLALLLTKLGEARQAGVFQSRVGQYPWQNVERDGSHLSARRFAWVRVAVPLAAAAAVAVLFVGPNLWTPKAVDTVALSIPATDESAKTGTPQPEPVVAAPVEYPNCDYNGDGVVDGKDIQAFLNRLNKGIDGDPLLEAEFLQRCLLSGNQ